MPPVMWVTQGQQGWRSEVRRTGPHDPSEGLRLYLKGMWGERGDGAAGAPSCRGTGVRGGEPAGWRPPRPLLLSLSSAGGRLGGWGAFGNSPA